MDNIKLPAEQWSQKFKNGFGMAQTEIKEIGAAVLSDILSQEGFKPETTPTPAVTHVRLPMPEFERIANDFGLTVRHKETYCDAAMYNPAGQIAIVFAADLPVNITVHDSVGHVAVTVHDKI